MVKRVMALAIVFCLVFEQSGFSYVAPQPVVPAYLSGLLNADRFRPMHLRALSFDAATQEFSIKLDAGNVTDPSSKEISETTGKLMEYFQIGLRLPNEKFWVNLRPDAADRVIDPYLERTDMGKVLLAADVQLKKDLARFTSPDTMAGKEYWSRLYAKAESLFQGEDAEIPTMTRPWIVPGEIIVKQAVNGVYIHKAVMNVMLEEDWIGAHPGDAIAGPASGQSASFSDPRVKELNAYSTGLIKELVLPQLTREVNSGKAYAQLRQVFYSLVLAQWFKGKAAVNGKRLAVSMQIDNKNLSGLTSANSWSKEYYFQVYKRSFEQGEYNKEERISSKNGITIRRYFSGGIIPVAGAQGMTAINSDKQLDGGIKFSLASQKVGDIDVETGVIRDAAAVARSRDGGAKEGDKRQQQWDKIDAMFEAENIRGMLEEINRGLEGMKTPAVARSVISTIVRLEGPLKEKELVRFLERFISMIGKQSHEIYEKYIREMYLGDFGVESDFTGLYKNTDNLYSSYKDVFMKAMESLTEFESDKAYAALLSVAVIHAMDAKEYAKNIDEIKGKAFELLLLSPGGAEFLAGKLERRFSDPSNIFESDVAMVKKIMKDLQGRQKTEQTKDGGTKKEEKLRQQWDKINAMFEAENIQGMLEEINRGLEGMKTPAAALSVISTIVRLEGPLKEKELVRFLERFISMIGKQSHEIYKKYIYEMYSGDFGAESDFTGLYKNTDNLYSSYKDVFMKAMESLAEFESDKAYAALLSVAVIRSVDEKKYAGNIDEIKGKAFELLLLSPGGAEYLAGKLAQRSSDPSGIFESDVAMVKKIMKDLQGRQKTEQTKDGGNHKYGGVDLRAMPINAAHVMDVPVSIPVDPVALAELDRQWEDIRGRIGAGTVPFEALKAYTAACRSNAKAGSELRAVEAYVNGILRMEEDAAVPASQEMKEILAIIG